MNEATAEPRVNKGLLIVLGVVLVAALVFFFVVSPLLAGNEDGAADAAAAAAPATEATPAPEPAAEPTSEATTEPEPVAETFEVFSARDPFDQLVDDKAATPAEGVTPAVDGDPAAAPTDPAAPVTDPTEVAAPSTQVGGTTIELVDVYTDDGVERVQVTVNGSGYEVAEGEVFAERLQVLDIDGQCATFLFGDSRFVLCEGEHIRK